MLHSGGNQCAIITGSYSPCQMEVAGEMPNWDECPFQRQRGPELLARVKEFRVHPGDSHPNVQCSEDGMSFEEWFEAVMEEA
ncbi:MAG: hypothetical protein PHR51_02670 [Patescibacteria group bacterium]|nr:hypothetical protein [Patescibacteria group bacterium]